MLETGTNLIKEGEQYLSAGLRMDFDAKGYDLVQAEVQGNCYSKREKRLAAIAWLREERNRQAKSESRRYWIPVAISVLSLVLSFVAFWRTSSVAP